MAFLSWPNQEPLVCPLAYITLMMTLPAFNAHLDAPLLCLVGRPCRFQSLERREPCATSLREREREINSRNASSWGALGPVSVDFAFEGWLLAPSHMALSPWLHTCMLLCIFHPINGWITMCMGHAPCVLCMWHFFLSKGSVPPFSFLRPRSHVVSLLCPWSPMLVMEEHYLDNTRA